MVAAPPPRRPRGNFQRRRDYGPGYASVYAGGYPQAHEEPALTLAELQEKTIDELRDLATDYGIEADGLEHSDLVLKLLDAVPLAQASQREETVAGEVSGILEIVDEGFAFLRRRGSCRLRTTSTSRPASSADSGCGPATGVGQSRPPKDQERYWASPGRHRERDRSRARPSAAALRLAGAGSPDEMFDLETTRRTSPSASSTSSRPLARASAG